MRRAILAALTLAACSSDPAPPPADAGDDVVVDTGNDAPGNDAPGPDQGGHVDVGADTGPVDTAALDTGPEDVSPAADADAPAVDSGPEDAGTPDAGPVDAGAPDAPEVGIACPMGLGDCDGDPANGCEVDLRNNPDHCGGCGMACFRAPNIVRACRSTVCDPFRCASGRANCDGDMANGCEINITTDARHCGGCGRACSTADGGLGRCASTGGGTCF